MRVVALALIAALACSSKSDPRKLDAVGRMMLDPLREHALEPSALIARLAPAPDAVVADIGAGPGFLTLPLARAVSRGHVIATDIDRAYLDYIAAKGVANVETRLVDPAHPGLAPSSVDLALLCQVDPGLPDRTAYFIELASELRPGGRIALVNYQRYRDADLAAARAANLRLVDEWSPSPPFFMLVFTR
ncbi:MAG TPA: class I SAM-dependent methyltransferase [Kofleriaceae bacterium]|jgi:SAM-dependent methyltransferase